MPSASLSGAIKTVIESAGLGLSVWRDDLGHGAAPARYCTVIEGISIVTESIGDNGAADTVSELVQVDLWQPWRAAKPGDPAEDYRLADRLYTVLHGADLDAPMHVYSCTVDSYPRLVERGSNVVHHAYTLRIRRER